MRLERALEVAHTLRRRHGEGTHCNASDCSICACMVLAANINTQAGEVTSLRAALAKHEKRAADKAVMTAVCVCGNRKIDGVCGRCDR